MDEKTLSTDSATESKIPSSPLVQSSPKPWHQSLRNWLWGYDFFISYHWGSGGTYAVNLAAQLRQKGYDVFLDRAEYAMGDKWKMVGEVALHNTQRLVLIATRSAVFDSKPVELEVVKFTDRGRHCIPIFFGDTFAEDEKANPGKFIVLERLPDDALYIEDSLENLPVGPAPKVVEDLASAHGIMRRRKLRQIITLTTVSILIVFATFSGFSWRNAVASQRRLAKQITEILCNSGIQNLSNGQLDSGVSDLDRAAESASFQGQMLTRAVARHRNAWRSDLGIHVESRTLIQTVGFDNAGKHILISTAGELKVYDRSTGIYAFSMSEDDAIFSVDGKWMISATPDGAKKLWILHTIQQSSFAPSDLSQRVLDVSHDHTAVLMSNAKSTIELWSLLDGTIRKVESYGQSRVSIARFSPDGKRFFVAVEMPDTSCNTFFYATSDLSALGSPVVLSGQPLAASLSYQVSVDGGDEYRFLTVLKNEGAIEVANYSIGSSTRPGAMWKMEDGYNMFKGISADGKMILSEYVDFPRASCSVLNALTGTGDSISARQMPLTSFGFSSDSNLALFGFSDGSVKLIDCRLTELDTSLSQLADLPHDEDVKTVAFGADRGDIIVGQLFLTATPHLVQVWATATNRLVGRPVRVDSPIQAAGFTPDGNHVFIVSGNSVRIRSADPTDFEIIGWQYDAKVHDGEPHWNQICLSPDGRGGALSNVDSGVAFFDVMTGERESLRFVSSADVVHERGYVDSRIEGFSKDGTHLVVSESLYDSGNDSRRLTLCTEMGNKLGSAVVESFQEQTGGSRIAVNTDGMIAVVINGMIRIGKLTTANAKLVELSSPTASSATACVFSPDGKSLAVGYDDGTLTLFGGPLWRHSTTLQNHGEKISCVEYNAATDLLCTAGPTSVRTWDSVTLAPVPFDVRHGLNGCECIRFTPDDEVIAIAGGNEIRLFETATKLPLGPPMMHLRSRSPELITELAFSQDGTVLHSQARSIYSWRVPQAGSAK